MMSTATYSMKAMGRKEQLKLGHIEKKNVACYFYNVANFQIKRIIHQFLVVRPTQNEVDSVHYVIEKKKSNDHLDQFQSTSDHRAPL
ncbi:hypothetical protein PR048_020238 [Dryococelus australis]|uniref:Uncharacterized protein n=1 Tax=Dryococelus australis TaxID=614101 RepID=A0ABQ9H5Q7_9NEOP|nr:hypothetical protein PR048_020238 [Dryococelus australis]